MKNPLAHSKWMRHCHALAFLPVAIALSVLSSNHAMGVTPTPIIIKTDSIGAIKDPPAGVNIYQAPAESGASTSNDQQYLSEIAAALPAGVSFTDATPTQIADAVAKVLIANPTKAVEIVAAAVKAASPAQTVGVATGVAKAFAQVGTLSDEAPKIAKVLSDGIAAKEGDKKALGAVLGQATAELIKGIDKSNSELITKTVTEALTNSATLDYTAAAYEKVMETVRDIDTTNTLEDKITTEVAKAVSNEVKEQIIPPTDGKNMDASNLASNPNQQPNNNQTTATNPNAESSSKPL